MNLVEEAARKGKILHEFLRQNVDLVCTGRGMVAAIRFESTEQATRAVSLCRAVGLLCVHTDKPSVKIGPPLTIPDDVLLEGLEILKGVLSEFGTVLQKTS